MTFGRGSYPSVSPGNATWKQVSNSESRIESEQCHYPIRMLSIDTSRQSPTVLIVEDCPEIQRYLRVLLEMDHYQVEIANCGEDAVQRMKDGCTPGLVLLDMQMPGMDGLQTLQTLKEIQPGLKVIMCSAEDNPDRIRQAISLGAQAYLVKPVQHLYLSAAVARCLAINRINSAPRLRGRVLTLPSAGSVRTN